jgi:hypothetical protein
MWSHIRRILPIIVLVVMVCVGSASIGIASAQSASGGCPTGNFINPSVSTLQSGYADAVLNVSCDGQYMYIDSNGIITYEFIAITPFDLEEQNHNWQIPLNPQRASSPSDIPRGGAVAVAINGIPFFGPNEAPRDDYGDPILDNLLDFCNGHTAQGQYHYHARPNCLYDSNGNNIGVVLGYAFDGYPILSPWVCADDNCSSVNKLQSSWQRTQDVRNAWESNEYVAGSGDLDQCNGTTLDDGSYAYFATDTFPYVLGCYTGVATLNGNSVAGGGQNGQPPQGQDGQLPPRGDNNGQRPPQGGNRNGGQRPPRQGGGG